MRFCGQCGLLLAPGSSICRNCGTFAEPELLTKDERFYSPDDATIAQAYRAANSDDLTPRHEFVFPASAQQQKLVLPSPWDDEFSDKEASYKTKRLPSTPTQRFSPLPGNPPQKKFATPRTTTPPPFSGPLLGKNQRSAKKKATHFHPLIKSRTGSIPPRRLKEPTKRSVTPDKPAWPPSPSQRRKGSSSGAGLVFLLLLIVFAVFVMNPSLLKQAFDTPNGDPTPTPLASPFQHAHDVLQRYYDDINRRNYRDAYTLWLSDPRHPRQPYRDFVRGYAHTLHDALTFRQYAKQADGTVRVDVTLQATNDAVQKPPQQTFSGYYIVGQQNKAWKIFWGELH